ncbi:hypothetical protein Trydic_g18099 [Trypoxylus dichotomus]
MELTASKLDTSWGAENPASIKAFISEEDGFLREGHPKKLWSTSPSKEQEQYGEFKAPIRKRCPTGQYPQKRDISVLAMCLRDQGFNISQQIIRTSESRQTIAEGAKGANTIRDDERLRYANYQNVLNCDIDGHLLRVEDGDVLV